ncbi:phage major capsid protein [Vibrio fluvialis]|uniref:phage major capsid protein n=1 Tax=Vibrio fluvialis TaxID=676 RepID=UPI0028DF7B74|nr:phage major capsid protein [Vibrio fluvialis]MDT8865854.1 phage major capsid protein [Vibrio fluvialis]MDT8873622.1 phage major capsid protein [Vibrio fluvialis]
MDEQLKQLEAIMAGVKSQSTEMENLKAAFAELQSKAQSGAAVEGIETQLAELKSAFADLSAGQVVNAPVDTKAASAELRKKFLEHAAKSNELEIVNAGEIKSTFNTGADSAGAGIVTELAMDIVKGIKDEHAMTRDFAFGVTRNAAYEQTVQKSGTSVHWEGENKTGGAYGNSAAPVLEKIKMTSGKAIANPILTNESITDVFFDAEVEVLQDAQAELALKVGDTLVTAPLDQTIRPVGFMSYFDAVEGIKADGERKVDHYKAVPVSAADIDTDEKLIAVLRKMPLSLRPGYRTTGKYYVSNAMFERIALLKDGMGRPMMQNSLSQETHGKFGGHSVVVEESLGEDKPVVFGDLKRSFKVMAIPSLFNLLRNPYVIEGCVKFTLENRIGTIVLDNKASIGLIVDNSAEA